MGDSSNILLTPDGIKIVDPGLRDSLVRRITLRSTMGECGFLISAGLGYLALSAKDLMEKLNWKQKQVSPSPDGKLPRQSEELGRTF